MVIQRLQNLWLLLAAIMLIVFLFVPFGYETFVDPTAASASFTPITAVRWYGYTIPGVVAALLCVIGICSFKNLGTQKLWVSLSIVATLAMIIMAVYVLVAGAIDLTPGVVAAKTTWGGGLFLLAGAIVAEFAALAGINADRRLLRSYDRLR